MSANRRIETIERTAGSSVRVYEAEKASVKLPRPRGVTYLAVIVLIMAGINLIRFIQALRQWDFLTSLPTIHPLYTALTGLFWSLLLFPLTFGLVRGLRWAPRLTWSVVILYMVYFWLDRLLFVEPFGFDGSDPALPFLVGATLSGILLVFLILRRKSARKFFGEIHE